MLYRLSYTLNSSISLPAYYDERAARAELAFTEAKRMARVSLHPSHQEADTLPKTAEFEKG